MEIKSNKVYNMLLKKLITFMFVQIFVTCIKRGKNNNGINHSVPKEIRFYA